MLTESLLLGILQLLKKVILEGLMLALQFQEMEGTLIIVIVGGSLKVFLAVTEPVPTL